jgi:tRNA(fMet)-specific endonuclease VapC
VPLYVLDTDMLSLFQRGHASVCAAVARQRPEDLAVTVITVEEQLSGWYTLLRRSRAPRELAAVYRRLAENVAFLARVKLLTFTEAAISLFEELRAQKMGIATMDLRIAAIALEHSATLVTRNLRDFKKIHGLRIEDWA